MLYVLDKRTFLDLQTGKTYKLKRDVQMPVYADRYGINSRIQLIANLMLVYMYIEKESDSIETPVKAIASMMTKVPDVRDWLSNYNEILNQFPPDGDEQMITLYKDVQTFLIRFILANELHTLIDDNQNE